MTPGCACAPEAGPLRFPLLRRGRWALCSTGLLGAGRTRCRLFWGLSPQGLACCSLPATCCWWEELGIPSHPWGNHLLGESQPSQGAARARHLPGFPADLFSSATPGHLPSSVLAPGLGQAPGPCLGTGGSFISRCRLCSCGSFGCGAGGLEMQNPALEPQVHLFQVHGHGQENSLPETQFAPL